MDERVCRCEAMAANMRKDMVGLSEVLGKNVAHWGGALSCTELLAVLYGEVLNVETTAFGERDKLLFSKGHASMALYTAMVESGMLERDELNATYGENDSRLPVVTEANPQMGIECSGGILGIGLSMGAGMALLAKKRDYSYHTYVIVGDGEMDEGSVWESIMFASQRKLDNLTLMIDLNGLQADGSTEQIMDWRSLGDRLRAFGWSAIEIDGHNCEEILSALEKETDGCPKAILAHTVKGKGISFMENHFEWHHKALIKEELEKAKAEVGLI